MAYKRKTECFYTAFLGLCACPAWWNWRFVLNCFPCRTRWNSIPMLCDVQLCLHYKGLFWWDWSLSTCTQITTSVCDYMFSYNMDVILEGYWSGSRLPVDLHHGVLYPHPISHYLTPAAFSIKPWRFSTLPLMGCFSILQLHLDSWPSSQGAFSKQVCMFYSWHL